MDEVPVVRTTKRRFWLCVASVFLGGVICGCFIGGFGLRYLFLNYPPPVDRIAQRVSSKVQRDFKLDDATRQSIRAEIIAMVAATHKKLTDARVDARAVIDRHIEAIAGMMPDEASRSRWLRDSTKYIPFPPPIPAPPPTDS